MFCKEFGTHCKEFGQMGKEFGTHCKEFSTIIKKTFKAKRFLAVCKELWMFGFQNLFDVQNSEGID